jgi:hypothetical protein
MIHDNSIIAKDQVGNDIHPESPSRILMRLWKCRGTNLILDEWNHHRWQEQTKLFQELEQKLLQSIRLNPFDAVHSYYPIPSGELGITRVGSGGAQQLLWHVCALGCSFIVISTIHRQNPSACIERPFIIGSSLLHRACEAYCDASTIEYLTNFYSDRREERDEQNQTPLSIVLWNNHPESVNLIKVLVTERLMRHPEGLVVPCRGDQRTWKILNELTVSYSFLSFQFTPDVLQRGADPIIFVSCDFPFSTAQKERHLIIKVGVSQCKDILLNIHRCWLPLLELTLDSIEDISIMKIVTRIESLQRLHIRGHIFSQQHASHLIQIIVNLKNRLTHLTLRLTYTHDSTPKLNVSSLYVLEYLDLRSTFLCTDSVESLIELISTTKSLKSLQLGDNNIGEIGMRRIYNALRTNKTIKKLSIQQASMDGLLTVLEYYNTALEAISCFFDPDIERKAMFWTDANKYGRGHIFQGQISKADFVDLLIRIPNLEDNKKLNILFALLKVNPMVWSKK